MSEFRKPGLDGIFRSGPIPHGDLIIDGIPTYRVLVEAISFGPVPLPEDLSIQVESMESGDKALKLDGVGDLKACEERLREWLETHHPGQRVESVNAANRED